MSTAPLLKVFMGKLCCLKILFLKILFCFRNHACLLLYAFIKDEGEACQAGPKIRFKKENHDDMSPRSLNSCSE